jgi:hypothetical protein
VQVVAYLSRYTHRTAIGNERIKAITPSEVVFSARAKGQAGEQGQKRTLRMSGPEFIGRFVQHILPTGLKRIRHYGLLANPSGKQLAYAKAALKMPAANPQAKECAQDFIARVARVNNQQCPACEHGRLRVIQTSPGPKRLPDPMALGQAGKGQHGQQGRTPPAQGP